MSPNDFCLWLQGYVELHGGLPNEQQWESIKDHLQLVMDKKSPVRNVLAEQFKINPKDLQITC